MRSPITILFILLLSSITTFGQGGCEDPIFAFDFSGQDRNTYVNCGKIFNSSIWVVVKESGEDTTVCWLATDDITLPQSQCSQPGNVTEVNIDIDQLGSPTPYVDFLRPVIQCDGVTMIDDTIYGGPLWPGGGGSNVTTITYSVPCGYPSVLKIYIQIRSTDEQNGFKVFSGDACGAQCYVPVILPIKLSDLTGTLKNGEAHFDIEVFANGTSSEPEVLLENSSDGVHFSKIPASVTSVEDAYHLIYKDPSNYYPYYRVKATDDNGETVYSNMVHLSSETRANTFTVSPNPVQAGEIISIDGIDGISTANLYNVQGGFAIDCTAYVQDTAKGQRLELPAHLARGLYVLEIQSSANTLHRNSLIVQ